MNTADTKTTEDLLDLRFRLLGTADAVAELAKENLSSRTLNAAQEIVDACTRLGLIIHRLADGAEVLDIHRADFSSTSLH